MADSQIEKLLVVQNCDVALRKIEEKLEQIPGERATIQAAIETEEKHLEDALTRMKQKEVQRSELEAGAASQEQAIIKFRNQQLEVKKNEEYRALGQQIEIARNEISELEEKQLRLMMEIDDEQACFHEEKAKIELRIKEQQRQATILEKHEAGLRESLDGARNAASEVRQGVDEGYLSHYERVKKLCKRPPYVVPIIDQKCTGCHLKVSNRISADTLNSSELVFCDQCTRIVYALPAPA